MPADSGAVQFLDDAEKKVVRRAPKSGNLRRRVTYDVALIGHESAAATPKSGTPSASQASLFSRQASEGCTSATRSASAGEKEVLPLVNRRPSRKMTDPGLRKVTRASTASTRSSSKNAGEGAEEDDKDKSKSSPLNLSPEIVNQAIARRICRKVEMKPADACRILEVFQGESGKAMQPITVSMFRQAMRRIAVGRDLNENSVQQAWSLSGDKGDASISAGGVDLTAFCQYWSMEEKWAHLKAAVAWKATEEAMMELAISRDVDVVTVEKVKEVFDVFDDNGSGIMDFCEFGEALKDLLKMEEDPSESLLQKQWKLLDQADEGEVDFPEFARWYLQTFDPSTGMPTKPVE